MSQDEGPDDKGATEDEVQRIEEIKGGETLGYIGGAREEHSGENEPSEDGDLTSDLADNENAP
ncbi:MAG: hypothetical protein ACYC7A_10345 [Thermoanaerobaculia bacterium]